MEINGVLWAFDHRVGKGVLPRELILSAAEYGYGRSLERVAGTSPPFDTAHTLSLLETAEGWVGLVDGWWHDPDLLVHQCLAANGSACHATAGVPADLRPLGAAHASDAALAGADAALALGS